MKALRSCHPSAGTVHRECAVSRHPVDSSMSRQSRALRSMWETTGVAEHVLQQMPCGIMISDAKGRTLLANIAAKRIAQIDSDERVLLSIVLDRLRSVHGKSVLFEKCPWIRALRGERTALKEYQVVQSDGGSRNILLNAEPIAVDARIVGAIVVLIDVTRRRDEEEVLQKEAAKRERSQIAADIHDTLCQELSAIMLQLRAAEDGFGDGSGRTIQCLRRARELAQNSLIATRDAVRTLSHEPLESKDLAQGLKSLAHELFKSLSIKLTLSLQNEPRVLAANTRVELLRLGREALINTVKHSQATKVQMELIYGPREVRLCIRDNGKGFVPGNSSGNRSHFGLIAMRKRAARLGGKCIITSWPGQGTRITVQTPLPLLPALGT